MWWQKPAELIKIGTVHFTTVGLNKLKRLKGGKEDLKHFTTERKYTTGRNYNEHYEKVFILGRPVAGSDDGYRVSFAVRYHLDQNNFRA